jgi:hypothetical protein
MTYESENKLYVYPDGDVYILPPEYKSDDYFTISPEDHWGIVLLSHFQGNQLVQVVKQVCDYWGQATKELSKC